MEEKLNAFLESSPNSEKVKLNGKVVIQRTQLTPLDIYNIKKAKQYGAIPKQEQICELEIGGQVLAKGKIIKKGDLCYFKVIKTYNLF